MLTTTDAIVLSLQPHSDKAHILHAYTRAGGRINYMVYGLGKKKSAGTYSPLSIVQITTDNKSIRTAQLSYVPTSITTDPYKRTIALFLSEVLYSVLRHPMTDEPMFDFLVESIKELDSLPSSSHPLTPSSPNPLPNFHLQFLIDFAAKLGFAIPGTSSRLTGGVASAEKGDFPLTRKERQAALRSLCDYYEEHVETWQAPRSLDVLMEVFD